MAIGDVATGLSIAGGLANTGYGIYNSEQNFREQKKQNKLDRRQQEKMYTWQRDDAREDWNTQNAYNSPQQQMERLRQAGLSPHLVYGKGADTTAMAVKSYNGDAPNQPAAKREGFIPDHSMQAGMQVALLQAQTDNVNADTILKGQEGQVKDATVASLLQNTSMSKTQQEQIERLKESVLIQANQNIAKTEADIRFTVDQNQRNKNADTRATQMQIQDILTKQLDRAKTRKEIEHIGSQMELLKNENFLKEVEIELRKRNQSPNYSPSEKMISDIIETVKKRLGLYQYNKKRSNLDPALQNYLNK